jgi:hypothetical protein
MTLACLFFLRHINSPFPRISYTTLLLFCPSVVLYDTWFENHALASCKTQKDFCSPENAMFPHYCLLVEKRVTKPWHKTQEENSIIYSFHALVPCARVCFWAIDLRNPGGNYETHCIFYMHSNRIILHSMEYKKCVKVRRLIKFRYRNSPQRKQIELISIAIIDNTCEWASGSSHGRGQPILSDDWGFAWSLQANFRMML